MTGKTDQREEDKKKKESGIGEDSDSRIGNKRDSLCCLYSSQ